MAQAMGRLKKVMRIVPRKIISTPMISDDLRRPMMDDSSHLPKIKPSKHYFKEKKISSSPPKHLQGPFVVFIACLPGLESLLLDEVTYLLATSDDKSERNKTLKILSGGVETIVPSLAHLYVLHLYLGTASHIYLRLNGGPRSAGLPPLFSARGFPELQRKIKELMISQRWDKLFGKSNVVCEEGSLPWQLQIHVTTSKSKLMHTKAVEERVRKSIGELLGVKGLDGDPNSTDNGAVGRPVIRLLVRIDRDEVQLSLDTSSASSAIPLHMRGYRLNPHKAPLREDLSFALLMAGGLKPRWNLQPLKSFLTISDIDNSLEKGEKTGEERSSLHLFDPLCGSGTIAIEAASILAGLPPGRFRPPPLEATTILNTSLWNKIKSKALSVSTSSNGTENTIMVAANDISKEAIDAAISNAKRAGVDHIIDFTVGSFKNHPLSNHSRRQSTAYQISDSRDLLLVTNPPYGKRLRPFKTSMSIYKQIANAMKAVPYGIQFTMTGMEPRLLRESSLPFNVAFSTKQGGLSVVAMSTGAMDKKN